MLLATWCKSANAIISPSLRAESFVQLFLGLTERVTFDLFKEPLETFARSEFIKTARST
jgi:hypothetical protein